MRSRENASPRVIDQVMPSIWLEGSHQTPRVSDRVGFVASFGASRKVSLSLRTLILELESCGYSVVLIRASDDREELDFGDGFTGTPVIVRKPNVGYDFGSWATGMELFPDILAAPFVVTVNDSLVGPFSSLNPILESFESSITDVWAATNTTQFFPHLQSFFMGFRGGLLADRAMRHFWRDLRVETDKQRIIEHYELGFSRMIFGEAYSSTAAYPSELVVDYGQNPSVSGWSKLLELGFPFVKRELIVNPSLVPDGYRIVSSLESRFGVDPRMWV